MGTNFSYDDTDHQIIFDRINGGAGSDSLQEVSRAWQRLGDDVGVTGKSYVQSAIRGILASRGGAAADAATAATGAMLPWMDDVALIASAAAQRAQGQADYWVTAKHNVPPVPPAPVSASFFGDPSEWFAQKMDWIPGLTTEEETAQQRRQDAAEQARQAMRVYQSSSNGNIDPAPAFTAPQALDVSIGALPLAEARVGGMTTPAAVGGGDYHPAAHQPAAQQPGVQPPGVQPMAAYQPVATAPQLAESGPAGQSNVTPGTGRLAGNPIPGQSVTPSPLPVGAGLGTGTAGRDSARPAPVHSGTAGTRAGGGAGRGAFGPRPSIGAAQFGPQPGASAPPSAEGMSGARGAATSVGAMRGAGYGEPLIGGAGQRGEQDREYRSKYLVYDDSNAIVGDLPPTAPPVIGEDPAY
ncbi:MAG: hypothetical protein ACRDTH_19430 [Pseudonocardiaceae bacterium]